MQIRLNGESVATRAANIASLLEEHEISPVGVAVAVNQAVIRRAHHGSHPIHEGDRIEIIRAVQGG